MNKTWLSWLERISDPKCKLEPILTGFTRCAENYHIPERTLNEHLIYQMVEHDIRAYINGREHILRAGELLWVPPGTRHEFMPAIPRQRVLVYHYRFTFAAASPTSDAVIMPPSPYRRERFAQIYDGSQQDDPLWLLRLRAVLVLTFSEIAAAQNVESDATGNALHLEQRQRIMHAIQEDQWLDPERLAQLLDYHPAYFTRLFKRSFGIAPRTWILQQRMQRAATLLLESGDTIQNVAEELGYVDPFIFSRQFKQIHGCSPRDWRKLHSGPKQLH